MALARNRTRINVKGGGKLYIREISPTASNTYLDLGYLQSTEFMNDNAMVGEVDEAGVLPDMNQGSQKATLKAVLKQSSIDEINLLNNAAGKYYELYYKNANLANGYVQELSIPIAKLKVGTTLKGASATERQLELEVYALAPKAAYTRGVTAFNVTENVPFILTENATAQFNTSNTEASALATAVL
jgi:hypothetical protein